MTAVDQPVVTAARAFDATVLGTLDTAAPLYGDDLPGLYARQIGLTAQRVRVLSAQLAQAHAEHGMDALVHEISVFDRETGSAVPAGEEITGLARLEGLERDRLDRQIKLQLQLELLAAESAERRVELHRRTVAALEEFAELLGAEWGEETRALARRAVVAAFGER